jgi:hypothetical protein
MDAILNVPAFYYAAVSGISGIKGNTEIENYFNTIPQGSNVINEKTFIANAIAGSDYMYKNIPENMSVDNKILVIMISNDYKFLTGNKLNDPVIGVSIFAKTVPVVTSLYKYILKLPESEQRIISEYLYANLTFKFIYSMTTDEYLAVADKLKSNIPEVPSKNKLLKFAENYRKAIINPPKFDNGIDMFVALGITSGAIVVIIFVWYLYANRKSSFGQRRR